MEGGTRVQVTATMQNGIDRVKKKLEIISTEIEENRFIYLASISSLVLAAVTIFWNFQRMGLSHWDEYYYVGTAAWDLDVYWGKFQAVEPPLFPFLLSIMFRVFGIRDYVAVATSGIMALGLCALTFWWARREYDLTTAIVSVLILASTSMFILYAKMALADMTLTFFFTATVFAYVEALKHNRKWIFLVAGLLLALTMGVKYNGFQPLLIILIFAPFFYLSAGRSKSHKRVSSYFRQVGHFLQNIWLSFKPTIVLALVYLAYLGKIFPPNLNDFKGLFLDFIPRVYSGWLLLSGLPGWSYFSSSSLRLFYSAGFYWTELIEFIGPLALALATLGVVGGLVKRKMNTILLVIWVCFVFIFFSSIANHYPRVILPLMIPLSILVAQGISPCTSAVICFIRALGVRVSNRKFKLRTSLTVCLVILIVLVQLYASIPAITNTHPGYREAAELLSGVLPNRVIFYRCQPVILVYTFNLGLYLVGAMSLLNQSSALVLDFIATISPDYPQIQARISHGMVLYARIKNDIPINMLDSTTFSGLDAWKSDLDRFSIRIYIQNASRPMPPSKPSFQFGALNAPHEINRLYLSDQSANSLRMWTGPRKAIGNVTF